MTRNLLNGGLPVICCVSIAFGVAFCSGAPPSGQAADATRLDPNMQVKPVDADGLQWFDPREAPFRLTGFCWISKERLYRRLPRVSEHGIPPKVNGLANHTAGGQIAFQSDSRRVMVRVKATPSRGMYHMAETGLTGFDCYVGPPGELEFAGVTRFSPGARDYTAQLCHNAARKLQNCVINFPLYNGVESVEIGLDAGAKLEPPPSFARRGKVVVYGTSITQGGCATRPGMCYTNILQRKLNAEFVNLGFSGAGKGEPAMAKLISEIDGKSLVVLDFEANTQEALRNVLRPFITELRQANQAVPILVVSRIVMVRDRTPRTRAAREALRDFQAALVQELREAGDTNIHFLDGTTLLEPAWALEATVDGTHPTDLGFIMMADAMAPVITRILGMELRAEDPTEGKQEE